MRWLERRLLRIADELERLRNEERLVEGELEMHRHLADDAVRDAVVHEGLERAEARDAMRDVGRHQKALAATRKRIARLETKRTKLLDRLGSSR